MLAQAGQMWRLRGRCWIASVREVCAQGLGAQKLDAGNGDRPTVRRGAHYHGRDADGAEG